MQLGHVGEFQDSPNLLCQEQGRSLSPIGQSDNENQKMGVRYLPHAAIIPTITLSIREPASLVISWSASTCNNI